jgi:hypothetical protein
VRENLPDQDDRLISAAQAAASWARARRAAWTSASLPAVASAPPVASPIAEAHAAPMPVTPPAPAAPPPIHAEHPPVPREIEDNDAGTLSGEGPPITLPAGKWLIGAAAVGALGAAAYVGLPYLWNAVPARTAAPPVTSARRNPVAAGAKAPAGLRVVSSPTGAQVLVDGKFRGVTPLTLADLAPGRHEVVLKSEAGTVRRVVTVAAGETAAVEESIFSGWVVVYSPFEVTIVEGGRVLRPDDRNQVMLPAGTHELRLSNTTLAYETALRVDVKPGEATPVRLTPPPSSLTVTAPDASEVWLDGAHVGDAPLNALAVPLGTHEIVVKRASGGERRFTVTIGVKPFTLNAEF